MARNRKTEEEEKKAQRPAEFEPTKSGSRVECSTPALQPRPVSYISRHLKSEAFATDFYFPKGHGARLFQHHFLGFVMTALKLTN